MSQILADNSRFHTIYDVLMFNLFLMLCIMLGSYIKNFFAELVSF